MLRSSLVGLSLLGMLFPAQWGSAAQALPAASLTAIDVQLQRGGLLFGQAVDAHGAPMSGEPVSVRHQGRQVVTTTADRTGRFCLGGLRGGTYEIAAGEARNMFRLWAPGTAPPCAAQGAFVVAGAAAVRGQSGPISFWLSKPWVIAGAVAAAVAVPVAIHNHQVARLASP